MGDKDEVQKTLFEAITKTEDASPTSTEPARPEEPVSASPPTTSPIVSVPPISLQPAPVPVASVPSPRPLSAEEKKQLSARIEECKKTALLLRNQLVSLNDKKRAAFAKKDTLSKKIQTIVDEFKQSKSERDKLTYLVKDSKAKRHTLNDELRVKIMDIQKLNKEKKELIRKHHLSADPFRVKKEIEELEYKIETEVPSPAEEKQLMKIIKEKKKLYEEAKGVSSIFEKVHALSKEIEKLKYKSDDTHKKIQNRAAISQEKHEEMLEKIKELNELRIQEKVLVEKYLALKKEFHDVNEKLQARLLELGQLQSQFGFVRKEEFRKRKKKEHTALSQRKQEVEQKFRQKKKLTTEDLIALQG